MTINTYSSKKYGGTKYGPSSTTSVLWGLVIDWENTGQLTGRNYASRMMHLELERGRKNLLNSNGTGFEQMVIGTIFAILDNDDGTFDPFNGDSELYPFVRPGVNVTLYVRIPGETTKRKIFKGKINNVDPLSGSSAQVRISAYDGMRYLREQPVKIKLKVDTDVDDAIGHVLDAAGWSDGRNLEDSADIIPFFFSDDDSKASTVIQKLADSSLSVFFIAQDGTAKYYDRNRSVLSSLTINQSDILKEISVQTPWEIIKNVVSIVGYPRQIQSATDLWSLYDKTPIGSGETIKIWGRFTYNGEVTPIRSYIGLSPGTHYTFNSQPDGSGSDLTANLSVSVDVYPMTVEFTLTNTGGVIGYITLLKIQGQPLTSSSVQSINDDQGSYQIYGKQSFNLDSIYLQDANKVIEFSKKLLAMLKLPQKYPTIQILNRFDIQFVLDLFDMVLLNIPAIGIGQNFNVSYIRHRWLADNGQEVHTELGFEPASTLTTDIWRFPTKIGDTSKFAF